MKMENGELRMENGKVPAPPEPEIAEMEFHVQIMGVQTMRTKLPSGAKSIPNVAASYWFAKAPKSNCPKCQGRGHQGMDTVSGLFIPCSCVGHVRLHQIAQRFRKFFEKKETPAPAEKL